MTNWEPMESAPRDGTVVVPGYIYDGVMEDGYPALWSPEVNRWVPAGDGVVLTPDAWRPLGGAR